jgi:hypothetical protein
MIRRAIGNPQKTSSFEALVPEMAVEAVDEAIWTGFPGAM